jgi:hypothetical protein
VSTGTIHVRGLREVQRAFAKCEGDLKKEMLRAGKLAAEPVAVTARDKISRYQGASLRTIRPRASARGAFVTQNARKVTGLRGDFGVLQMRLMMDALEEQHEKVVEIYELAVDHLTSEFR